MKMMLQYKVQLTVYHHFLGWMMPSEINPARSSSHCCRLVAINSAHPLVPLPWSWGSTTSPIGIFCSFRVAFQLLKFSGHCFGVRSYPKRSISKPRQAHVHCVKCCRGLSPPFHPRKCLKMRSWSTVKLEPCLKKISLTQNYCLNNTSLHSR